MTYPYEKRFKTYLKQKYLEEITITDISHDVSDFFNYLRHFNENYQALPAVDQIQESDVRDYFNMLQVKRQIKNTTYNKVLTHINTYFTFLFSNQLSVTLPTLRLKGLERKAENRVDLDWVKQLPDLLGNDQLSFYSRLVLLCSAKFFTVKEFLSPDFYKALNKVDFSAEEKDFLTAFKTYISPLQDLQESQDLFLKQRVNIANPRLSTAGLHKYLHADQKKCAIALVPRELYRTAICYYLLTHQSLPDKTICQNLRFTMSSLNYYRQVAAKMENETD